MSQIKSIVFRKILNSHVNFTNEFIVKFTDGSVGVGSSPLGETISIYEDKKISISPEKILEVIDDDGYIGKEIAQADFDDYLKRHIGVFGRNNTLSLSLAFFNANRNTQSIFSLFNKSKFILKPPRLCLNILNGGRYAYTNPVLSDFSEFMLVAKSDNIEEVIAEHNEIQRVIKEKQLRQNKVVVAGNPVNVFATSDNRECIEFLLTIRDQLGFGNKYELMIDASGGGLWSESAYHLKLTDKKTYSSEHFYEYWMNIINQYGLRFLEDPFSEKDINNWQKLTTAQTDCYIIGDDFYSSDEVRVEKGAANNYTHGVVIKPNQAGTVTAIRSVTEIAARTGLIGIASHRSISTEETFLSLLSCIEGLKFIKIGPLQTDYSSILRLNEIIRLTGSEI